MDPFLLRVALSIVLGGLAVALFTAAAERMGSRVGGLLLSFPVKVTIALLLIGLNEGALFAAHAAAQVPVGIGVNVVFLAATALLVRRLRPWPALLAALSLWLVAGLLAVLLPAGSIAQALLWWLAPAAVALALLAGLPGVRGDRRPKAVDRFGWRGLLARAAGAGAIVGLSIVLARVAGPVLGGLASVFPSGWITTMVILTRGHGPEFTGATVRVMVTGSAAPVAFGVTCALAMPAWGAVAGVAAGIGAALAASLLAMAALRWRDGRKDAAAA
ncbi:MAG TPA: DUF3147 family protein [Candidatus Thermoplasmatota archaeon]|nr:DUF3147 family protein [Candidatus Thermoplasmatota archaeon]